MFGAEPAADVDQFLVQEAMLLELFGVVGEQVQSGGVLKG